MSDLKGSTMSEKVLLGIIAASLATLGFYIGYAHLSNGVNSLAIGLVVAFVLMVGGVSLSFIVDELIKKFFPNFHPEAVAKDDKDATETSETNVSNVDNEDVETKATVSDEEETFFKTDDVENAPKAKKAVKQKIKRVSPFAKKQETTTLPTSIGEDVEKVNEVPETVEPESDVTEEPPVIVFIDEHEELAQKSEKSVHDSEHDIKAREDVAQAVGEIARLGRDAGRNIVMTTSTPDEKETPQEEVGITLADFIALHPMYPPRKMSREYVAAGGKESTANILELMS